MPRKAKAKTVVEPVQPSLESEKENVADGASAPNPKSPPMRAAATKGLNTGRNWEEELEAMTQKLKKISLEKEEAQRRVEEQEATIKEQHDKLELQLQEKQKLQEKLKKLGKVKPFQPVLTSPLPDSSSEDEKKKKNDPDRLKRPATSYILWCNDNRAKVRADHPEAGPKEITTLLSEMWKSVSEEEKRKYEEEYKKNKAVYAKEASKQKSDAEDIQQLQTEKTKQCAMEVYQQFLEYQRDLTDEVKSKKKEKDPEKPKKPATAYMVFCRERRPALTAANHKSVEVMKILGEEWKSVDAEARVRLEKIAAEEKGIYLEEMEAYNQKKSEEDEQARQKAEMDRKSSKAEMDRKASKTVLDRKSSKVELDRKSSKAELDHKSSMAEMDRKSSRSSKAPPKTKTGDNEKVKRPPTAYALFGKEYRDEIKSQKPGASFTEVNGMVAAKWKEMSADDKKPFTEQAAAAKQGQTKQVDLKRADPDSDEDEATSSEH